MERENSEDHPRVESLPTWRHVACGANHLLPPLRRSGWAILRGLCDDFSGIVYLLAIREFFATPIFSRRVVVVGLVLAAVWHIAFLRVPAGADDDIHRYVWDGRACNGLGYNPYIVVPNDPALDALRITPETRNLNNPDLPQPLSGGCRKLFFRAITAIHESVFTLESSIRRLRFLRSFSFCSIYCVAVGKEHTGFLAYAWNPLLAVEVAGSGHIDIVGVLLLLVSVAALLRRWRTVAAVAFGLAVAVKLLPIVLLPLYWKRVRLRDAALAAVVVALLYVPFLNHGHIPTGSLGTYVHSFRFNDPIFTTLERVAAPEQVAGLAVLAGFLAAIWMRSKSAVLSSDAFARPMAASLLCAPVVYPWYLVWMLPFLRSASTLPIIIWTVSIIPTYYVWHLRALGRPWVLPGWIMLLEYGCVAMAVCDYRRAELALNESR